jgi:XRE family transcriptional regulator of biofilm formation
VKKMALAENIKRIAEEKGLSIYRISKDGRISQSYMSDIVNGKCKNPSITIMAKLSKVLEVDIENLIS